MPRRQVKLSLNDQEYKLIKKMAANGGLPISTFVKSVVLSNDSDSKGESGINSSKDGELIFLSEVLNNSSQPQGLSADESCCDGSCNCEDCKCVDSNCGCACEDESCDQQSLETNERSTLKLDLSGKPVNIQITL